MRAEVLDSAQNVIRSAGHARDVTACLKIILEADKINVAVTKLDQPAAAAPVVNIGLGIKVVSGDGALPL